MKTPWLLSVPEYYAKLNSYILQYGLPYAIEDFKRWEEEGSQLSSIMGEAGGCTVLDCSCGWGRQSIALAQLGWRVTATDISETSIDFARLMANGEQLSLNFSVCNMCDLARRFDKQFDWVISCYGIYEIPTDEGIQQALQGIFNALKPGGSCYFRFRDMDFLMIEKPRHIFHGEKKVPYGRMIAIEDWDYISATEVVALFAFLREDERYDVNDHLRWTTETIGCKKRVLLKADFQRFLQSAGFDSIQFLPQPEPWYNVQVVAARPSI